MLTAVFRDGTEQKTQIRAETLAQSSLDSTTIQRCGQHPVAGQVLGRWENFLEGMKALNVTKKETGDRHEQQERCAKRKWSKCWAREIGILEHRDGV